MATTDETRRKATPVRTTLKYGLALDSWKRSMTVPFRRLGGYGKSAVENGKEVYRRYDGLTPATDMAEVHLAIMKCSQSAVIYGLVATLLASFLLMTNLTNIIQEITLVLVLLCFGFRCLVDIFIIIKGKAQIQYGYLPKTEQKGDRHE